MVQERCVPDLQHHFECKHYEQEYSCSFECVSGEEGSVFYVDRSDFYGIVFLKSGRLRYSDSEENSILLTENTMVFIDKVVSYAFTFESNCELYYLQFYRPARLCENFNIRALKSYAPTSYEVSVLSIVEPLNIALQSLKMYREDGLKCGIIMDAKLREVFFVLRSYYEKEPLASFLAPLLREEIDFKEFVLTNYLRVNTVQELAQKKGITLRLFNKLFKEAFNATPYQWMLEQKGEVIKERLSRREVPFTDIIEEFGFSSPSHFTVYCRKQFGETPSRLRKKLIRESREGI